MKRKALERNFAATLFIMVIVVFAFADRDSKKLDQLYLRNTPAAALPFPKKIMTASTPVFTVLPQQN